MPTLLIRHQRVDFGPWYEAFHNHLQVRQAHGAVSEVILRNAFSPDDVWVLIEWDDLYRAQLFSQSEDLQDQLDQSGILRSPNIWFLEPLAARDGSMQSSTTEGGTPSPADATPQ